jgi:hypothetical protein
MMGSDGGIKVYLLKTTGPTKKQKWAVMMVGAGRSYLFTRNSFMQNVVKQSEPPMDVFTFTKKITNSSCLADLESMRLLQLDSTVCRFDENYLEGQLNYLQITEDRFVRQHTEAFQLIESYAEQQSIKYEYIFYTRPDLFYTIPFNITELEKKLNNVTDNGINGTLFSPECCSWAGWCDQLAAAKYQDFARMIHISREWFSRGDNKVSEDAFRARGQFANLSNFDLRLKEDYGHVLLRMELARESCSGNNNLGASWTDSICNAYATFDINSTLETCEILNSSSICVK